MKQHRIIVQAHRPLRPTADTYGIHYLNRAGDCRKALVLPFPTDVTR